MHERKKLSELLEQSIRYASSNCSGRPFEGQFCGLMADYLIDNGVIVPPCKVGDTVYIPYLSTVIEKKVCSIVVQKPFFTVYCGGTSLRFSKEDFGKTVFLTREEAEKALEERSKT